MSTLRCFFAIYTDGGAPVDSFVSPPGTDVFLGEMPEVFKPDGADTLFGPYAARFARYQPKRGFLLGFSKPVRGSSTSFFVAVRKALLAATAGLDGYALDVLRLWPLPLSEAADAIPDDPMAEDLFSVGLSDLGDHGWRCETFGLAKLGQREITFAFRGKELLDEAALMCGHLADWVLEHPRRVEHGHSMAFGFDRIVFHAAEGAEAGGPFRGWHPPVIQRLLPEAVFPGVGVLEVYSQIAEARAERLDLTGALQRALEQRLVLEDYDLAGDAPYAGTTARVRGGIQGLNALVASREEPEAANDSGWSFDNRAAGEDAEEGSMTLAEIARRAPDVIRYLALPAGVRLEWAADGTFHIDTSRTQPGEDEGADDGD